MFMHKRRLVAGVVVAFLLVVGWWLRHEPSWDVSVSVDADGEVTPWQTIKLTAELSPSDVTDGRLLKGGDWTITWEAGAETLTTVSADHLTATWRSGHVGDHDITVTVVSPWGTRKTATLQKIVAYKAFMAPNSPDLQAPDPTHLPNDPRPLNLPFGIDDVYIEKSKICQGESTQIKVTPYDKRGRQAWLTPVVDGKGSWETTFTVLPGMKGPRMILIKVADEDKGKGGAIDAVTTFVYVEVMDCVASFPTFIDQRPIPPHDNDVA